MFCRKFAQIKKGSSAGRTLDAQREIPFLAESMATCGNMTIRMQHPPLISPAMIIRFLLP